MIQEKEPPIIGYTTTDHITMSVRTNGKRVSVINTRFAAKRGEEVDVRSVGTQTIHAPGRPSQVVIPVCDPERISSGSHTGMTGLIVRTDRIIQRGSSSAECYRARIVSVCSSFVLLFVIALIHESYVHAGCDQIVHWYTFHLVIIGMSLAIFYFGQCVDKGEHMNRDISVACFVALVGFSLLFLLQDSMSRSDLDCADTWFTALLQVVDCASFILLSCCVVVWICDACTMCIR